MSLGSNWIPRLEILDILTVTPEEEGNCNRIWGYFYEIKPVSTHVSRQLSRLQAWTCSRATNTTTYLNQPIKRRQVLLPAQQSPQIRQLPSLRTRSSNQSHRRRHETSPTRSPHICCVLLSTVINLLNNLKT